VAAITEKLSDDENHANKNWFMSDGPENFLEKG
jgi:hypothetical protein